MKIASFLKLCVIDSIAVIDKATDSCSENTCSTILILSVEKRNKIVEKMAKKVETDKKNKKYSCSLKES